MLGIDLSGRRALITGSSSGLGRAMAEAFAEAGARIAVHYRSPDDLADQAAAQAVAAAINQSGGQAQVFAADISQASQVDSLFKAIDTSFGGLDILVNNAGMDGAHALCSDSDIGAWETVVRVDLFGAYYCARQALQRMNRQKRGVILNITSVHEFIPWEGYSAYASAKAGLSMFTKTLAQETADTGIRVLAIAPGAIQTPINQSVWANPVTLQDLDRKIAMGRLGTSREIATVAAFLASDLASYMTGTTVAVDGGMLIYPDFRHGG
ncbi:short-chain dehydrogenase/reductase SDR [mine drainage metagenome]|uniref:Short-chain dehydrogenase/reductase SDR n=2 Tax=mine drainage metagenome TaxID=410659 RepID=T0ZWC2_9ZZZZ